MCRRRVRALGLTVAVSAAVLLGGVATPARSVAGVAAGPTAAARACVALVVDARSIGSDVSTSCPKLAAHATGLAVLQAAGHTLGFRGDGLLCTIDGLPKTGCADVTDTHYWAYFHRAAGSTTWVYSSEGPATYEPAPGTTEGWVYDNGSSLKPDDVPYPSICGCRVTTPAPSSTPRSASPKPPTTRPPTPTASSPSHAPASTPAAPASTAGSDAATATPSPSATTQHRRRAGTDGMARDSVSVDPRAPSSSTGATADPALTSGRLAGAVTPTSGGGHGLLDLVIVVLVIAGLAGFAIVQSRRRRTD